VDRRVFVAVGIPVLCDAAPLERLTLAFLFLAVLTAPLAAGAQLAVDVEAREATSVPPEGPSAAPPAAIEAGADAVVLPTLMAALNGPFRNVRMQALRILGRGGPKVGAAAVLSIIESVGAEHYEERWEAAHVLVCLGPPVLPEVRKAMNDELLVTLNPDLAKELRNLAERIEDDPDKRCD
jgi:hypothetical protein